MKQEQFILAEQGITGIYTSTPSPIATALLVPGHVSSGLSTHYELLANRLALENIASIRYQAPLVPGPIGPYARTMTQDAIHANAVFDFALQNIQTPVGVIGHSTGAYVMHRVPAAWFVGLMPVNLRKVTAARRSDVLQKLGYAHTPLYDPAFETVAVPAGHCGNFVYSSGTFRDFEKWSGCASREIPKEKPALYIFSAKENGMLRSPILTTLKLKAQDIPIIPVLHHFRTAEDIEYIVQAIAPWIRER